ncbi:two-component sensor histidine kinase [Leucobacter coleopterorum]|uniref:histidine kinase n=1 Tax=Leucobacter coleopterorum TaxID=2714933 RepID=A0ABX6JWD0_9MICO|nr:histidine kinase [Leucobacter coleopterorum]QIM18612.1 two-component sensor histidine kinase [Leucobacter coleopterorum]
MATPQDAAEAHLPRPPGVIRRAFAAHPKVVDITIVVTYFFGATVMTLLDAASNYDGNGFGYLAGPVAILSVLRVLVVGAALFFRRRFPLAGLIVISLAQFGDHGAQMVATSIALYFLLYAVPVYRNVTAGWLAFGIALASTIFATVVLPNLAVGAPSVLVASPMDFAAQISLAVMNALWLLAVLMLGINLGNRRRYVEAIIDRAHQLARERDQLAQLAVAEERSRIAREMHDIVAHSVSVMIALSEGASRTMEVAPEAAADAMQRSAETGRTALAEMRRLLGALQEPGEPQAEFAPQPGASEIPDLVQGFRDVGLNVGLEIDGQIGGDQGKELAVYRIIQEALTNVLRYAGVGTNVVVTMRSDAAGSVVEVRDSGPAPGIALPVTGLGSGRGLAGLAERVRVFGGSFDSGPLQDAPGWCVRATFPLSQINFDEQY